MSVKMNTTDMPAVTPSATDFIPVAVAGVPKSVTPASLAAYTVDAIEAIAATTTAPLTDSVFILQGGALKPVPISTVAQNIVDSIWAKTAETAPDSADILALKDGGTTEKTVTLALLAEYVRATVEAAILDVSNLAAAGALAGADLLLVTQGAVAKKVTLTEINTAIYAALAAYVTALGAATSVNDADVMYILQSGVQKKVALSVLKAGIENAVLAPSTSTENKIPQWSSTQKKLKDGLTVATTVRSTLLASDSVIPTEKAVRALIGLPTDEGIAEVVVDDVIIMTGTVAGVAVATIPAGCHLKSIQANITLEAVAGSTSVKAGLGVSGDPSLYGLTAALTVNSKIDTFFQNYDLFSTDPAVTYLNNSISWTREAIDLVVYPCATDGLIGDTGFSAGWIRVRIAYDVLNSLASV